MLWLAEQRLQVDIPLLLIVTVLSELNSSSNRHHRKQDWYIV